MLELNNQTPTRAGEVVVLARGVRRVVANNPSPFTFTGTCTYLIGEGRVAILDPGPMLDEHIHALYQAVDGQEVSAIVVTHTHKDHSPAARVLAAHFEVPILGAAPHRAYRPYRGDEKAFFESSADLEHCPAYPLHEGDKIEIGDYTLRVVHTPGHTANHLAFALETPDQNAAKGLFSGDHVMGWSTTIVAPPDGHMGDYMASLEKLLTREEDNVYWPGHGEVIATPSRYVRGLLTHRRQREAQILESLQQLGGSDVKTLVTRHYPALHPNLRRAAELSVLAHVEDLITRSIVKEEQEGLHARYALV